jgi:hypothetical protein
MYFTPQSTSSTDNRSNSPLRLASAKAKETTIAASRSSQHHSEAQEGVVLVYKVEKDVTIVAVSTDQISRTN